MAATVKKATWKTTGDALADAMAALNVAQRRTIESLRPEGWFLASEFADRCGTSADRARRKLQCDKFDTQSCRVGRNYATAFRLKD